jgi:hypothetical protein
MTRLTTGRTLARPPLSAYCVRVSDIDAKRTKPRLSIVMTPEGREMADKLAASRLLSLSQLLEQLVRAEVSREKKKR